MTTLKTRLSARDDFDSLRSEQEQPERKIEIIPGSMLEELVWGFERLARFDIRGEELTPGGHLYPELYKISGILIPETCTQSEIQELCFALKSYENIELFGAKAGLYLSALINCVQGEQVDLSVNGLEKKLSYLGAFLDRKKLTIRGDVAEALGFEMYGGEINLEGDAAIFAGFDMNGGIITIKGNAGAFVGSDMNDGTIYVKGPAGYNVGMRMKGGNIFLEGDYVSLGAQTPDNKGKIYHRGNLIVRDGGLKPCY